MARLCKSGEADLVICKRTGCTGQHSGDKELDIEHFAKQDTFSSKGNEIY